jgi:non-canonical poly(A) RNA polymerase PAPD5/7
MLVAPARPDESLLARILRLGPILISRPRDRSVGHLRLAGFYLVAPPAQVGVAVLQCISTVL